MAAVRPLSIIGGATNLHWADYAAYVQPESLPNNQKGVRALAAEEQPEDHPILPVPQLARSGTVDGDLLG